jgi:hypothetical protein
MFIETLEKKTEVKQIKKKDETPETSISRHT